MGNPEKATHVETSIFLLMKNSKLFWDCHQSLVKLVEYKKIQLVRVPKHNGIDGNEIANKLAR
jgi:ribonuclease HI